MIPRVIFVYSWIYDKNWSEWIKVYKKKKKKSYPSIKKVQNYIKRIEKVWRKEEKSILKELSKITKLQWKEKEIKCYIVGRCIPFSYPLTMRVYKKDYRFVDVLTHELIHQLFIQNSEKTQKAWPHIKRKYRNKPFITKIHIPLHAIHMHIYMKLFDKKRLNADITACRKAKEYKISWEIVQKEGYQNIIDDFVNRVKIG